MEPGEFYLVYFPFSYLEEEPYKRRPVLVVGCTLCRWRSRGILLRVAGLGAVIIFLRVSLFIFAVCGLGGLIVVAAFAAMAPGSDRIGALALLAIAFWVEVVLVLAVVSL